HDLLCGRLVQVFQVLLEVNLGHGHSGGRLRRCQWRRLSDGDGSLPEWSCQFHALKAGLSRGAASLLRPGRRQSPCRGQHHTRYQGCLPAPTLAGYPPIAPMNAPVDVSFFARAAKPLTSYRPYWAKRFGTAPFLPMSRAEMEQLGWDSCDIVLVTGDAYIDHPSFGM